MVRRFILVGSVAYAFYATHGTETGQKLAKVALNVPAMGLA
jgi:hypothetical protein